MNSILFIVFLFAYIPLISLWEHPITSIILFGVLCFLTYRLLRLKFKFSKKIIVFTAIIAFFVTTFSLNFFFNGCIFGYYNYVVPVKVQVSSITDPQRPPVSYSVELVYRKGKYDAALKHLVKQPAIGFHVLAFGCLGLAEECHPPDSTYSCRIKDDYCFRIDKFSGMQQGKETMIVGQKGEAEFVREVSHYKPEPKFYQEHELSDCNLVLSRRYPGNDLYFRAQCAGERVECNAEFVQDSYRVRILVPWFGEFEKIGGCEFM